MPSTALRLEFGRDGRLVELQRVGTSQQSDWSVSNGAFGLRLEG